MEVTIDGQPPTRFVFFQAEGDARSVCGAAPTYVFLHAIAGTGLEGRVLRHDLWEIDASTGSHVSFAAVAYERPAGSRS